MIKHKKDAAHVCNTLFDHLDIFLINDASVSVFHNTKDMEKLWIAYDKCAFGQWKDEYYEPVLDGETWQLEFYGRGVCVRQIVGSNGYPEKWKDFLYLL